MTAKKAKTKVALTAIPDDLPVPGEVALAVGSARGSVLVPLLRRILAHDAPPSLELAGTVKQLGVLIDEYYGLRTRYKALSYAMKTLEDHVNQLREKLQSATAVAQEARTTLATTLAGLRAMLGKVADYDSGIDDDDSE